MMINVGPPNTVPEKFNDGSFYQRNSTVTMMPTTVEEKHQLGEEIGRKGCCWDRADVHHDSADGSAGHRSKGQAFDDPAARLGLNEGIRASHDSVELIELDNHINDAAFTELAAQKLLHLIPT